MEVGVKKTSDNSQNEALSEVIEMQHVMNKTISKNVVDVKLPDKEIKWLLKKRDNKNSSREKLNRQ